MRRARSLALSAAALAVVTAATVWQTSGEVSHAASASGPDSAQTRAFSQLADPSSLAAALPSDVQEAATAARRHFDVATDAVHEASFNGVAFWIIPGNGNICIAARDADGLGMACGTDSEAESGKLALVQRSTNGGTDVVYGLAPDSVENVAVAGTADSQAITPSSNVYVVEGTSMRGVEIYASRNGTPSARPRRLGW